MAVAFVFLVSCVAVLANRAREVRFSDGGLFEAKKKMSQTCVVQSECSRLLLQYLQWPEEKALGLLSWSHWILVHV